MLKRIDFYYYYWAKLILARQVHWARGNFVEYARESFNATS
jgi:hypothetical protein